MIRSLTLCFVFFITTIDASGFVNFADDFDNENGMVDAIPFSNFSNWNLTKGTVDLIFDDGDRDFFPSEINGGYLDLDGTDNGNQLAGTLVSKVSFDLDPSDETYTLEFDLGNTDDRFGPPVFGPNTMTVSLTNPNGQAPFVESFTISEFQNFSTIRRTFSVEEAISDVSIVFDHEGGDQLGLLLDNVSFRCNCGIVGDFDNDGQLTGTDIDMLNQEVRMKTHRSAFDLQVDGKVDETDRDIWILELANTYFGDSNLDGVFDTTDLILVFEASEYEDGTPENSTWVTGDWSGDTEFNSGDLILAFQDGGFEIGPRNQETLVPEPKSALVMSFVLVLMSLNRNERKHISS